MTNTVMHDGVARSLCLHPAKHSGLCRKAQVAMPIYDRPTIIKMLTDLGGKKVLPFSFEVGDQKQTDNCWDWATIQMVQVVNDLSFGDREYLSPSVAPIVCNALSGGNSIDACWKEVGIPYGFATARYVGDNPLTGQMVDELPLGWQNNARLRKGVEAFDAGDFLTLASGILNDHPGVLGVHWGGGGGHCIGCMEIGLRSDGRSLYMATPGTWGAGVVQGWGGYPEKPGWYKLNEGQTSGAFDGGYGAYVMIGVKDEAAN